jgi:hypothetical protein
LVIFHKNNPIAKHLILNENDNYVEVREKT